MIEVQGAKEIAEGLKELGKSTIKKIIRRGLRVGCKPITKQAKANVNVVSGQLRRSIRAKVLRPKGDGTIKAIVGPSRQVFKKKKDAFYAPWVEKGHFLGKRPKGKFKGAGATARYQAASVAAGRKFVPGQHFMERAKDSKGGQAVADMQAEIIKLIEAEKLKK